MTGEGFNDEREGDGISTLLMDFGDGEEERLQLSSLAWRSSMRAIMADKADTTEEEESGELKRLPSLGNCCIDDDGDNGVACEEEEN